MREILFRAKSFHFNKWIEGYYAKGSTNYIVSFGDAGIKWQAVKPETVGQFTGLKDRYGTEIFEGDLLEVNTTNVDEEDGCGVVLYDEGTAGFIIEFSSFVLDFDNLYDYQCEVIGNIHDNPELIGGADNA